MIYHDFDTQKRARASALAQLTRLYNVMERDMLSHDNVETVRITFDKLQDRFREFKSAHIASKEMCDDSDVIAKLEDSYASSLTNFTEFEERLKQWLSENEKKAEDNERLTSVSHASSASSRTKLLSAKAKRLVAERRLKQLRESQRLELARKQIEMQQQMLQQQGEVDDAIIEQEVWKQAEQGVAEEDDARVTRADNAVDEVAARVTRAASAVKDNTARVTRAGSTEEQSTARATHAASAMDGLTARVTRADSVGEEITARVTRAGFAEEEIAARVIRAASAEDVNAARVTRAGGAEVESSAHSTRADGKYMYNFVHPEGSNTSVSSIDTAFQRLVSTLHEGFNLPKPELLTFDGNPTNYCKFIKNFEVNIESRVSDDSLRLSYLIQHCRGEAKYAIEDCVLLVASEGYRKAREILYSRYGKPHLIARNYIENLVDGPEIKATDIVGLAQLALEMRKCEITLSQLGFVSDVDNSENLRRIVKRLPMHTRVKWVDVSHAILESGREPCFKDLAKFVDERARVANSMYGTDLVKESSVSQNRSKLAVNSNSYTYSRKDSNQKVTTLSTQGQSASENENSNCCCCCSGSCPDLATCRKFKSMSHEDRTKLVRNLKLCFNCLNGRHFAGSCRKPKDCKVKECKSKHHFLLHKWAPKTSHTITQPSVNCTATKGSVKNCLGIIPVTVVGGNGNSCQTYALLDDGADKTLCAERLLQTLDLPSRPVTFKMSTATSAGSTISGQEVDLHVQSIEGDNEVQLRKVWSVKTLPISTRSAPKRSDFRKMSYLADIDIPEIDERSVMLLIGTDSPEAHVPLEVRSGKHDQPYAIRTKLGWAVRGPVPTSQSTDGANVHFHHSADVSLQQQLEKMWTTDFCEKLRTCEKSCMSLEDKRALKIMEESLQHKNGHYTLKLPWRDEAAAMPNNLPLAHARLEQLRRKLLRDPELHQMYTATVTDYINKGYATEVPINATDTCPGRIWYLPHHPVTNPNKPGKLRVVFDCAARYKDVSLNSHLLQGPDLMNSLVGVIIRFRQENVALAADIEAMFHQVKVQEEDCNALRFLWWPDGDLNKAPKCYRMQVHLFGATSSPSCTAYALKRTAIDNADLYEPDVISTVERNFYVDDCLKSVPTETEAIKLASDLQSLMKLGGFRLTKWLSNRKQVINSIPESERAPSVVNLDKGESLPLDRALGVHWDVDRDEIKFKVKLSDKPLTRRGILSIVSTIFDPLGLVSPVTLPAKAIVQNLCRQKLGWDDEIPEQDAEKWTYWISSLPQLENISVRRCFKPQGFGCVKNTQLHLFSDGSELGYGACAYLRLKDVNNNVTCSLVAGKSRLAPIKQTSIPRLELSGAVLSSQLYGLIVDELEINIDQATFWTDSMIVLGYIKNETRRFKTFVGNRIGQIHELTSPRQWRHVDTKSNPADLASRGIDTYDTENLTYWLNGPEFLLMDEEHWPHQPLPPEVDVDDAEVKKEIVVNAIKSDLDEIFSRYSDWTKLRRAVAWLLRFKSHCRRKYLNHNVECSVGDLTVKELQKAESVILTKVQGNCFSEDLRALTHREPVNTTSRLASLNPVLQDDLIRVHGRISRDLHVSRQQPIILPNEHHVTKLLILDYHRNLGHIGVQQVLASVREKYWIIKGHATVKRIISPCVTCKRLRGRMHSQQMAPLREEQTTPDMPPFTFVGVDYFGPLKVKEGSNEAKRYGCLFTCLNTRAVHLEVTHSLSTDSFISAFQRFTSRRGRPQKIFSDNGTNLVSGANELRKSIRKWNQSRLRGYFTQKDIEWHFNPPNASHMGGAWERLIRSTRTILKALVGEQLLTDEQLTTLMTETEKILNDRPLTPVSSDPRDPPALTPNMLLLMKSSQCIPPGVFRKEDIYAKRWWRQVQYLADIFWRRWLREYIPALQKRQKWQRKSTDLKKDDVVLVVTENVPRGQWPLARVEDVNVGRDGLTRSCVIRTQNGQLTRPITKLCLLESSV